MDVQIYKWDLLNNISSNFLKYFTIIWEYFDEELTENTNLFIQATK